LSIDARIVEIDVISCVQEWAPEDALEMENEDLENLGVGDLIALAAQVKA
jgi:hypothetical protein